MEAKYVIYGKDIAKVLREQRVRLSRGSIKIEPLEVDKVAHVGDAKDADVTDEKSVGNPESMDVKNTEVTDSKATDTTDDKATVGEVAESKAIDDSVEKLAKKQVKGKKWDESNWCIIFHERFAPCA